MEEIKGPPMSIDNKTPCYSCAMFGEVCMSCALSGRGFRCKKFKQPLYQDPDSQRFYPLRCRACLKTTKQNDPEEWMPEDDHKKKRAKKVKR